MRTIFAISAVVLTAATLQYHLYFYKQWADVCQSLTTRNKSWSWSKFSLTHHNCGRCTEAERWTGMMTNCQSLQSVTSYKNIKCQKTQNIMVIVSRFPFQHSSDNLFGRHGRQRKKSIKSRETEKHSHSSTHASCDHGSEKRQFSQNFPFIMNSQAHKNIALAHSARLHLSAC